MSRLEKKKQTAEYFMLKILFENALPSSLQRVFAIIPKWTSWEVGSDKWFKIKFVKAEVERTGKC